MAINYPGISYLRGYDKPDILGEFQKGYSLAKGIKDDATAPDAFSAGLPALQEFGLGDPEALREMFRNPQTRALAIEQVKAAQQRRQDASDPMRQLQMRKAQMDLTQAGRGPEPTAAMREFQMAQSDPKFAEFIGASGAGKAPAEVQAYLFYRNEEKAAGREAMPFLDFKRAMKSEGLSVQTNPDGTVSISQGGAAMPKLTEGQSKDVVYLTKGAGALPLIDQYGDALTDVVGGTVGQVPVAGNFIKSEDYQQAEQAGKEFLAAILRKDTGAAVTKSEEDMYGTMYLPRPGDKPAVLQQKKAARSRALKAIELGIPAPAILAMESQGVVLPGSDQAAPPDAGGGGISEGTVIENDEGVRLVLRNGQWVPVNG